MSILPSATSATEAPWPRWAANDEAREAYLEAFSNGWIAALEWLSPPRLSSGIASMAALQAHEGRVAREASTERLRRLDAAEAAGPQAYAEERERQGLVPYRTHAARSTFGRAS
ncbi:hypothetical protein ACFM35_00860 [Microbacterium sp. P01]|uniref:hypothetical protein n=1 Tax=Microbacterium sp. P01 TaxID=3366261 RepID=UPI00366AAB4D